MGKDCCVENVKFDSVRDALSFLLKDEADAVDGYDRVLREVALDDEDRRKIERIRNAEIDHIKDLSDLYQKHSTINIVGKDSKKWIMHKADSGYFYFADSFGETYKQNGQEVRFGDKVSAGEFYIKTLYSSKAWGDSTPSVVIDARSPGMVVRTNDGWIITTDSNGWLMYMPYHNGALRYGSTFREQATVFKTESEANAVAKDMLKTIYKISDSKISDYSGKGSFNTLAELKAHYAGCSLLLGTENLTVVLKSGAELVYTYGDGGRLIFMKEKTKNYDL